MNTNDVLKYLQLAGTILSAGGLLLDDVLTLVDKMVEVKNKGTVSDQDWEDLHVYEKKQTDILDAPMEGENTGNGDTGESS